MEQPFDPVRYAVITDKNPREIVMLRGRGCSWRRCRFCDYHLDSSPDERANFALNKRQLDQVRGLYKRLEVINSGCFVDLDAETMALIEQVCEKKGIERLHFECHWINREAVSALRERFKQRGVAVKIKVGVETFDKLFRDSYLDKGIDTDDPAELARYFDECCLLQGIPGQSAATMIADIETGLKHFERVCVNIMHENTKPIRPDAGVIAQFMEHVYPAYKDNERVDILLNNTDFGVG